MQRSAHLHPAIESRTLACVTGHGKKYSDVCNAALYMFLESGDEAQADALRVVSGMRTRARKTTRRMGVAHPPSGVSQSRDRQGADQ